MTRITTTICAALLLLVCSQSALAAKLRAVMYVGGCCHDYKKMPANLADHPITRTFPAHWKTPGDELYNTIKMMPTATPLLTAKSPITGKVHTVAWINNYHGTRVFCTTLGHDMKTGADPAYLQLLTNGILWTCGRLDANGNVGR